MPKSASTRLLVRRPAATLAISHARGRAATKGFWSELLGVGDFYYELAVQIIEVCLRTRSQNGGLIAMEDLMQLLRARRGKHAQEISECAAVLAVCTAPLTSSLAQGRYCARHQERSRPRQRLCHRLGRCARLSHSKCASPMSSVCAGPRRMVQSVPRELNTDHYAVLTIIQVRSLAGADRVRLTVCIAAGQEIGHGGSFGQRAVVDRRSRAHHSRTSNPRISSHWPCADIPPATHTHIRMHPQDQFLKDGILWIDQQSSPPSYWLPTTFSES